MHFESPVALMVRFPSECSAVNFWYDDFYQTEIKPLRLNPSAGDYVVTLYNEADSDVAVRQIVAGAVWKLANSRDAS